MASLPPDAVLGYCTNVHAGTDLARIRENLDRHARAVRDALGRSEPLGLGLWLPASAAHELIRTGQIERFRRWLAERGLCVFTLNGFPYGDFHRDRVKHAVYEPDWRDPRRLAYTRDLIRILAGLRPEGAEGSISTLPLGWRTAFASGTAWDEAAESLRRAAVLCQEAERQTGRLLHLDLEPEPGAALDRAEDVARLFETRLRDDVFRRHLRVCHDICHGAVMFEPQRRALARYREAGVAVGKVQISSAPRADFRDGADPAPLVEGLESLAEGRYLHQTVVRARAQRFYDDLPDALHAAPRAGEWRVHFHVPVHFASLGALATTQPQIDACLSAVSEGAAAVRHFELETYAWNVLPPAHRPERLSDGIADELAWVRGPYFADGVGG